MNRNRFKIKALGILFPLLLFGADDRESESIKLEAHSGPGSILLTWDLPENEIVTSIQILRSSDMMSSYEIIDLDGLITDRYLDSDLSSDDLIFYRLEMETLAGKVFSSSQQTPALARSKPAQHLVDTASELELLYPVTVAARSEVTDIHGFKSVIFHDFMLNYFPYEISQMDILQMVLLLTKIDFDSFLDILNIENFKACEFLFAAYETTEMEEYFDNAFRELEPLLRQQVLLTPKEWYQEKVELVKILDRKMTAALDIYADDTAFLETLPPVRITGMAKDSNGINITLHQFTDQVNSIELHMHEELLSLPSTKNKSQTIAISDHWDFVDLQVAGYVIQTLPVVNEDGLLTISLDDQYLFSDTFNDHQTMRSIPEEDFQLNEIAYNAGDQKLAVEIAGQADWSTELGLFINDSLLWAWNSPSGFEISFVDSNWTMQTSKNFGWLHLCQLDENDMWKILESRPLNFNETFHESKVPDLGTWTTLSFSSFGESNDITGAKEHKQFIPEIFALYQNYPNPFNASTNITFDLLEEATVSLYVADARGRKLQVFLEEIFLEKGFYSFDWSAEYQSSGVYFITLQAQTGEYLPVVMSRKMIYLK